jgi:hypothetical protein
MSLSIFLLSIMSYGSCQADCQAELEIIPQKEVALKKKRLVANGAEKFCAAGVSDT